MGNIFSDENEEVNNDPKINNLIDFRKLSKIQSLSEEEILDWDFHIGSWIENVPYYWRCGNDEDWRTCSRRYIFKQTKGNRSLTGRTENPYIEQFFLVGDYAPQHVLRMNGYPLLDTEVEYQDIDIYKDNVTTLIYNYPENIVVRDVPEEIVRQPIPEKERFIVVLYMNYLQKKYPNVCFPLFMTSEDEEVVSKKMWKDSWWGRGKKNRLWVEQGLINYIDVIYSPSDDYMRVFNEKSVKKMLEKCFSVRRMRFICLNFGITIPEKKFGHANVVIIDKLLNNIYIIDPWGEQTTFSKEGGLTSLYDSFVDDFIMPLDPVEWRIYESPDICPYRSFQTLEDSNKLKNDPGGFCYLWSLYIADLLMSNPNEDFSIVVRKALAHINSRHESFTNFIRAFAVYIHEHFDEGEFTHAGPKVKYSYFRQISLDYEKYLDKILEEEKVDGILNEGNKLSLKDALALNYSDDEDDY